MIGLVSDENGALPTDVPLGLCVSPLIATHVSLFAVRSGSRAWLRKAKPPEPKGPVAKAPKEGNGPRKRYTIVHSQSCYTSRIAL